MNSSISLPCRILVPFRFQKNVVNYLKNIVLVKDVRKTFHTAVVVGTVVFTFIASSDVEDAS